MTIVVHYYAEKTGWKERAISYRNMPRSRRLPWLRCLHCGYRLVRVEVHDGRTYIRTGRVIKAYDELLCPKCGHKRMFHSTFYSSCL
jgi:DNA-directed RNA polymerase subunit RPC12/RpoP